MTPEEAQRAIENLRIEVPRISIPPMPRITPLSHFLSGEAAFKALRKEVEALVKLAPTDHDVLIEAFGILVRDVRFIKPHTLLFRGVSGAGHETSVIIHFTQLVAHIVYMPKKGPERVITGFATEKT